MARFNYIRPYFRAEFEKRQKMGLSKKMFKRHMKNFAKACWATMEAMHQGGNSIDFRADSGANILSPQYGYLSSLYIGPFQLDNLGQELGSIMGNN